MRMTEVWSAVERPTRRGMHAINAWIGWPFQCWFKSRPLGGQWVFQNTTPNFWSLLRLPLAVGLGIALSANQLGWAIAQFILGLLTDRLDGELARAQGKVSTQGMIMDTVSDAVFLSSVLLGLAHQYPHRWWPHVVVGLEAIRLLGALLVWTLPRWTGRQRGLEPNMSGKFKTGLIACSLLAIFLTQPRWSEDLIVSAVIFSLWSMGRHLYDLIQQPRIHLVPRQPRSESEPPLAS